MKSRYKFVTLVLVFVLAQIVAGTPLDDYVKAPDDNYRYSVVNTIAGVGYTDYVLDMTSQSWRNKDEVDRMHVFYNTEKEKSQKRRIR